MRLRRPAPRHRPPHGGRRGRHPALSRPGGARERHRQQDPRLQAPGAGLRHLRRRRDAGLRPRPAPLRVRGRDAAQLGVKTRAHHDQQPAQDRGAREGRPRRRLRRAGHGPPDGRERALSRLETRPRRPLSSISIRSPRLLRRTTEPGPPGRGPLPAAPLPAVSSAAGWPLWPTLGLFGLAWLALSWPWLSGRVTIPWDAKAHFYPQLQFLAQSIHRGEAPFWAPYVFSGHPQIADPQSLIFSPPHLLLALLDADPGFRAADAVELGMLGLGGVALILLFRDRGWHPVGAVAAALAFAFGASAAWRIQHVGQVMSLSYLADRAVAPAPRAGAGLARLRADGRRRRRADGARARPGRLSRPLAARRRRALVLGGSAAAAGRDPAQPSAARPRRARRRARRRGPGLS